MTTRTAVAGVMAIALCAAGGSACQSRPKGAAPKAAQLVAQTPAAHRSAPSLQDLKNATYRDVEKAGTDFTPANGKWYGKPYEPGAALRPSVAFVRDLRLAGDLDGDGAEEAVALLAAGTGGTGEMSYVAVVGRGTRGNRVGAARVGVGRARAGHSRSHREVRRHPPLGTRRLQQLLRAGEAGRPAGRPHNWPPGATRMMCPEPAMTVETRFLQQLGGVTQMRFMAGQLALPYANTDKTYGVMLFDRRPIQ